MATFYRRLRSPNSITVCSAVRMEAALNLTEIAAPVYGATA